jgi:mono/diheme cytochrome c family protein
MLSRRRPPFHVVGSRSLWASLSAAAQESVRPGKFYQMVGGKVDAKTYNGFRRYNSVCSHCHGPDGMGSTFGPSLIDKLSDFDTFRRIVREGRSSGASVMKGFAGDSNVEPYVDDIYAYLQARADGAFDRGRPVKMDE